MGQPHAGHGKYQSTELDAAGPGAAEAVVAVNFTAEPQTVNLAASGAGLQALI